MLFSDVGGQQRINDKKNAGKSLVILIAMAMQWYNVGCITQ